MRISRLTAAAVAAVLLLAACTAGSDPARRGGTSSASAPPVSTAPPSSSSQSSMPSSVPPSSSVPSSSTAPTTSPSSSTPSSSTPSASTPSSGGRRIDAALPLGGTTILPTYRVVADYGAPYNSGLGVLGRGSPTDAARRVLTTATGYAGYGRPVQPAMELIATVAQGSPGPDGDYSAAVSESDVRAYLAAAKAHRMLLVLDFQPGRGEFLPQVQQFADIIADPWVGVALDPEWKVGPGQKPAQVIGSATAAEVNSVSDWLARFTQAHHLPQKLFVVHQFTLSMLPDRQDIVRHSQLATVFHADGHGTIPVKRVVYQQLAFPGPPFGTGFKLFYDEDATLMTPAQVMALDPRPDLVTYE